MTDHSPSSLPMQEQHPPPTRTMAVSVQEKLAELKEKVTTVEGWVGRYDYKALCMPRIPCLPERARRSRAIFFGVNDRIPILLAMLMGFQHALAMMGGAITVPRILAGGGPDNLQLEPDQQAYLISTALVVSGLMSIIQIVRIRLVRGYWIGTGLISMSGISFTFLPIAQSMFRTLRNDGFCPTDGGPCPDAYGRWLGTIMVGSLLEIALSFVPPRTLRKTFPPIVTGTTVFLIGASLVPVGLRNWAGGAGPCLTTREIESLGATVPEFLTFFLVCPNAAGPRPFPWGASQWIGLGFFVFSIIILIEMFGSPFMRNAQVMIGLVAGIILSAALGYMDTSLIDAAPAITFPLVERFKLGFYLPALIPVLIGYAVSTVETLGDIAASCEVSRVATEGEEFESRVQGGLLADGVNSLIAGLLTSSPTTTFSQNNGVIAMTRCANRSAGLWASGWLILMGVVGKLGGVFVALPDAALGGMTVFLFANVAVSGIRIFSMLSWTRRERFILAISISLGLGVIVVPKAFVYFIPETSNVFASALRQSAILILTTGYSVGALLAATLNLLIPEENDEYTPDEHISVLKSRSGEESSEAETEVEGTKAV